VLQIATARGCSKILSAYHDGFENVSLVSMPARQIARGEMKLTAEVTAIYTPVWHQLCCN